MHLDVPHPSHSLYILGLYTRAHGTQAPSHRPRLPLCVPKTPLSLLKTSKHRETLEIFALPLYRCGHDHDYFRHCFPAPVPPRTDQSGPLTNREIEKLNAFLLSDGGLENAMDVSTLDGFLCAVLSGPNVIIPSEWMRWVWDVYGR
jgi:hypothetical protein